MKMGIEQDQKQLDLSNLRVPSAVAWIWNAPIQWAIPIVDGG